MHEDIAEILITEEEIRAKVAALGEMITRDYRNKNILLLGTLKGAVPFIADLARAIPLPLEIDYMAISSYGNSTHSRGVVRILKDLEGPIDQKDVLIVEDIIDSGLTLHYLMDVLNQRRPLSLRVCTLLDKGRERVKPSTWTTGVSRFPTVLSSATALTTRSVTVISPTLAFSNLPSTSRRTIPRENTAARRRKGCSTLSSFMAPCGLSC